MAIVGAGQLSGLNDVRINRLFASPGRQWVIDNACNIAGAKKHAQ